MANKIGKITIIFVLVIIAVKLINYLFNQTTISHITQPNRNKPLISNSKDTSKFLTYEYMCKKPKFFVNSTEKNMTLICQIIPCRADTFQLSSKMTIGELKSKIKLHFEIDQYNKLKTTNTSISRDVLIVTPTILPEYAYRGNVISASETFGTSLGEFFVEDKISFLEKNIGIKYEGNFRFTSLFSWGNFSYFISDERKIYKAGLIQLLDTFSNKKAILEIYTENGLFLETPSFRYRNSFRNIANGVKDGVLELTKYHISIIGNDNLTIQEAGIKNGQAIHFYTIGFNLM